MTRKKDPADLRRKDPAVLWTPERVSQLEALRNDGLTFARCAKVLGLTRSTVIGADRRHIKCIVDDRPPPKRNRTRLRTGDGIKTSGQTWNERTLTETWTERKARRAREASL